MLVIHVGVNPEKPLEDGLGVCEEIIWEGDSYLAWEEGLVVQLILDPGHQKVDVLGGGALDRLLHLVAICPVILQETKSFLTKLEIPLSFTSLSNQISHLIFGPGRHDGTGLLRAELCDGAVQHVDLVKEVHGVHGDPLIKILSLGKHNG